MITKLKENGYTIYLNESNEKFRIVEKEKNYFIVEKLFKTTKKSGFLWWKKEVIKHEWKWITREGNYLVFIGAFCNIDRFKSYKTIEEAKEWIINNDKYPIYH